MGSGAQMLRLRPGEAKQTTDHCFLSHGFKRYAVYTLGSVGQVMVSFMLSLHAPCYGAVTYRVIFQGGRSQSLPVVLLNSTSVSPLGDPR